MKRADLLHHLRARGCRLVREGSKHSVFTNTKNDCMSTIPRHGELHPFLVRKICKDLGIVPPRGK
ncbi:addiction module toxin, HicA family [Candidatus Kaiserbacteria bacterium CG10_big_fil_rev_8_21_14_0_10_56_12]|uniref:Addiction module toxin, HicA family n=1 Tax=Candidatus Kaiserbacteria bacterium CG10_big_fil_rev_8_21_14_0_10_56_12 TaxID=1974611 RepID=A0A2H0U9F0_9BACT|nr:MAG: addiction module toxin, HicA family [Candidatus Kaiserbacteria bacterium CG10_big_fil_rev_8_21_14_0_10_56_12]